MTLIPLFGGKDRFHISSTPLVPRPQHPTVRLDSKVLLFVETQYSHLGKLLTEALEASRMKFKAEISGKSLPMLTNLDKGKFAVIIFENFEKYLNMNKWNRELLDKYCREYGVGIIGFMLPREERVESMPLKGFPIEIDSNLKLRDYHLNPSSPILRITRVGETHLGSLPGEDWIVFHSNHSTYLSIGESYLQRETEINMSSNKLESDNKQKLSSRSRRVTTDQGLYDGIQRVIFGNGFNFWLHKLILLDSISYLSRGKLSLPLQRHILIDIDDIFVGEQGTRMKPSDVESLLDAQRRLRLLIPGFRFNLGFSGKYFHKGTPEEDKGDDMLIDHAHEFWWFCHMWSHSQPHLYENITVLEAQMRLNKEFAEKHNIPIDSGYSIAPHHSGVYPVHEPLYEAWKRVWNVRVTSTEEYPHLRPARLRRGFIHRGIMTCGLYTHTIYIDKYPGGRAKLDNSIMGGELFYSFVFNPISVFMTHMSNYGNDRLALYTFESVIKFVQCWTNLRLQILPPIQLATKYFQMHPEESDPIWMNPCNDKRHFAIWSSNKSCEQLPKFLVIGPQKTGTTALYTFLTLHPAIQSNYPSPETFEEVQFFNGKNYYKGLDWYMNFYPLPKNSTGNYFFEKSATYFDGELVPMRAHSLLPNAKIITILISPIKRAYSWYQHVRGHRDPVALNYSFHQVITANEKSPKTLRDLRNRCLNPGCYAVHLEKWLNFYSPQQLMIIDGEELKADPVSVMNRLQRFLKIEPFFDYKEHLRFDPRKGFFCQVTKRNDTKCLGRSKGRLYSPMDPKSEKFLQAFYMPHNVALSKLLTRLHQPIPPWLEEDLSHS
ncbi:Bifunctional heparan sulfate N-deacetylase/N-sulfotransferase-like protein [Dinothrombium tinctorium]|uniref:[heparan sulfate]-glucosamine N-sulfotransferase n=1 Tax=Dinothrombium tinctorium TaxID=1965070 RepID=A0A3S3P5H5_9ACAR|nr:Bifunctional heparan sulfate N-deacetylase/N-sulfotransferase-like protein [Dinothrombium tinctorium]RWS14347.1 Bifunctional heparan sulfate N-deacetylase/N-sulfotransferase-like protein [Dinothrombium tinctorium]RWS14351.1 Bifunctional heparan sulfate N-deacetylase/N-sulfotransferase-like protein [Dinothrombium tinctorium]